MRFHDSCAREVEPDYLATTAISVPKATKSTDTGKCPIGVVLLATLAILRYSVLGLCFLVGAVGSLTEKPDSIPTTFSGDPPYRIADALVGFSLFLICAFAILVAISLVRGKVWAWILVLVFTAIDAVFFGAWEATSGSIAGALVVFIIKAAIFYYFAFAPSVRRYFERA